MCAPSTEDTHVYWQLPECLVLLSAYALTTLWHRSHLGSFPEPSIGTEELSTSHDGNFSSLGAVEHMLEHVGVCGVEWDVDLACSALPSRRGFKSIAYKICTSDAIDLCLLRRDVRLVL
jgi:hypothetical protein